MPDAQGRNDTFYVRCGKDFMDRTLAVVALILLAPILALIMVGIAVVLGWPVFFVQERPGLHGHGFRLVKFRTMASASDASGSFLPDAQRLTRLGSILRQWSLDELPELVNVVLGQMSLVGPRPLRMEYLRRYTPEQRRRHEAKPGISGWAQVNGRNAISWDERFKLDVWYVDHVSLWLDLKILAMTISSVLLRKGISTEGHATTPEFMGSERAGQAQESGHKDSHHED